MLHKTYSEYLLTNPKRTLYVGVTSDLIGRIIQHRTGVGSEFTRRHKTHQLVWFETTSDVWSALEREKQIKSWKRDRKLSLVGGSNPIWIDLSPQIGLPAANDR